MGWCPLLKGFKAEATRGKHDLLPGINRAYAPVTDDAHREPQNAWLRYESFPLSFTYPPINALQRRSGWMRCVLRACGKSLTNTSLTTQVIGSLRYSGGRPNNETGSQAPCAYHGQPRHHVNDFPPSSPCLSTHIASLPKENSKTSLNVAMRWDRIEALYVEWFSQRKDCVSRWKQHGKPIGRPFVSSFVAVRILRSSK